GAVVDIQQRALRTFEHDARALLAQLVQPRRDVGDQRLEDLRVAQRLVQRLLEIDRLDLVEILQNEVVVLQQLAQLDRKTLRIEQITDAQTTTRDLVFVGRTDTTTSGADLAFRTRRLARLIQRDVIREDQGAGWADT